MKIYLNYEKLFIFGVQDKDAWEKKHNAEIIGVVNRDDGIPETGEMLIRYVATGIYSAWHATGRRSIDQHAVNSAFLRAVRDMAEKIRTPF